MSDGIINLEEERQGLLAQIRTLTKERDKCISTCESLRHTIAEHAGDDYRIHSIQREVEQLKIEKGVAQSELAVACEDRDARTLEVESLRGERDKFLRYLERAGWGPCNIAACNCNGWHAVRQSRDEVELCRERDSAHAALKKAKELLIETKSCCIAPSKDWEDRRDAALADIKECGL